jgi:hypothetical protein
MMVGIQGSRNFNDYSIFISGMAKVLVTMKAADDKELVIFSAGPYRVNQMAQEYLNVSDFKGRGIKTKFVPVPPMWFKKNHSIINHFAYFCNPKDSIPELVNFIDSKDVLNYVHRY